MTVFNILQVAIATSPQNPSPAPATFEEEGSSSRTSQEIFDATVGNLAPSTFEEETSSSLDLPRSRKKRRSSAPIEDTPAPPQPPEELMNDDDDSLCESQGKEAQLDESGVVGNCGDVKDGAEAKCRNTKDNEAHCSDRDDGTSSHTEERIHSTTAGSLPTTFCTKNHQNLDDSCTLGVCASFLFLHKGYLQRPRWYKRVNSQQNFRYFSPVTSLCKPFVLSLLSLMQPPSETVGHLPTLLAPQEEKPKVIDFLNKLIFYDSVYHRCLEL
jgi:hypothetical protein